VDQLCTDLEQQEANPAYKIKSKPKLFLTISQTLAILQAGKIGG